MKIAIAILFLLSANALACDKGCDEYKITPNQKVCTCDVAPEIGTPVQPSDEKPPRDRMPSYEREGIRVDAAKPGIEPSTTTAHDFKAEAAGK